MRHLIIIISLFLTLSLSSQTCEKSNVTSYLNDPDTSGTNLRNCPNGEILYVIKNNNQEEDHVMTFEILNSKENWLYVKTLDNYNEPEKRGWIYGELVSVDTRNYSGQKINLYTEPNESSSVKNNIIMAEQTVYILDVCGQWAYIRFTDESGHSKEGRLEPEMQCGNPYTTCG